MLPIFPSNITLSLRIQKKETEQYFPAVLFTVLNKVVSPFKSMHEICYVLPFKWRLLLSSTNFHWYCLFCCMYKVVTYNFRVCQRGWILNCKHSNDLSTKQFLAYYIINLQDQIYMLLIRSRTTIKNLWIEQWMTSTPVDLHNRKTLRSDL